MIKQLDLKELGDRLKMTDRHLMSLLKKRMDLAWLVSQYKQSHEQPMFRPEIESERLDEIRQLAEEIGLDPNFARTMLYIIIGESCKKQMMQVQSEGDSIQDDIPDEIWQETLKRNLLELTRLWAPNYDKEYSGACFATLTYLEFERELLKQEIKLLEDKDSLIDLGCATGKVTSKCSWGFKKVVGFDISADMIKEARLKLCDGNFPNVEFAQADIEDGIPKGDSSVSFVTATLGTASDIPGIDIVLAETERVLKQGGRFLFSFYNANALVYRWEFLPWPVSLAAKIDSHRNCLEVKFNGKVLPVYAKPYTVDEVKALFKKHGLKLSQVFTYPTISSMLPNDLFQDEDVQKSIKEIDQKLSESDSGAYIIVTGEKPVA